MYRLTEKGWGQPRWSALTPAGAAALVGYVYAERHLQRSTLYGEALVCALWCAGAPWDQIAVAARDLARGGDRRAPRRPRETGCRARCAARACQLFDPDDALVERLRSAIAGLADDTVRQLARLSGKRFVAAARDGDGDAWTAEVVACVRGGISRDERSADPESPKLLNRALGYRDVGGGVLWASMIPIGAALGLELPPLPDDLSSYVSTNFIRP